MRNSYKLAENFIKEEKSIVFRELKSNIECAVRPLISSFRITDFGIDLYSNVDSCSFSGVALIDDVIEVSKKFKKDVKAKWVGVEKNPFHIEKVIFNDPATIVYFKPPNGKTEKIVVKTSLDEQFDPEKGLAMAIMKYHYGGYRKFLKFMEQYLPKENENEM